MFIGRDFLIQLTNSLYRLTLLFPKKEPLRYKMREIADDILAECLRLNLKQELKQDTNPKEYMGDSRADLEVLDAFFEVAKEQNWVSPEEILKLQENYSKLGEELKTEVEEDKSSSPPLAAARVTDLEMTLTLPLDKSKNVCSSSPLVSLGQEKEAKNEFIMLPLKEDKSSSHPFAAAREAEEDSSISERQEKILAFLKEQGRAQVWQVKQVLPEVTKRTLRRDFESLLKKRLVERTGERNNTFYQIPSERGERRESNSLRTKITQAPER